MPRISAVLAGQRRDHVRSLVTSNLNMPLADIQRNLYDTFGMRMGNAKLRVLVDAIKAELAMQQNPPTTVTEEERLNLVAQMAG